MHGGRRDQLQGNVRAGSVYTGGEIGYYLGAGSYDDQDGRRGGHLHGDRHQRVLDLQGRKEIAENGWITKALGHSYGQPVWTWADDGKTAEVKIVCANDKNHVRTDKASLAAGTISSTENNRNLTSIVAKILEVCNHLLTEFVHLSDYHLAESKIQRVHSAFYDTFA